MSYPAAAINEAFQLLPAKMDSRPARVILAAIGYQETKYLTRVQYGNGPARGFWQMEKGGGVKGVMEFKPDGGKIADLALKICDARGVPFRREIVWAAMAEDDVLAAAFARLLMYTDAAPLPTNRGEAWEMYANRVWNPGKPHKDEWEASWSFGLECVR